MASSGEAIGWMAAIASMLAFGSFGVPIKSDAANSVDIDPLVFQSYKSFMCFATSWLVLLAGVPFSYTPWGIVSCIFWVPGGVATVFAIRNAGLAIAIGIGGSSIVLVSFIWGIFIFQEAIHSRLWASIAVSMMMTGICGMSYYSSRSANGASLELHEFPAQEQQLVARGSSPQDESNFVPMSENGSSHNRRRHFKGYQGVDLQNLQAPSPSTNHLEDPAIPSNVDPPSSMEQFQEEYPNSNSNNNGHHNPLETIYILGFPFTRRQVGIACALFNGIYGGSIMVPMHWCHGSASGVGYLISFGVGAAVVTTALWVFRYIGNVLYYKSMEQAYHALPSFHLKVMWCAGGTSGLLWSIGNFFSLISVYYLGEGVGYSVVQAGMLGKYNDRFQIMGVSNLQLFY
jgi:hypothetical protein